jgi:hypothetical protein
LYIHNHEHIRFAYAKVFLQTKHLVNCQAFTWNSRETMV